MCLSVCLSAAAVGVHIIIEVVVMLEKESWRIEEEKFQNQSFQVSVFEDFCVSERETVQYGRKQWKLKVLFVVAVNRRVLQESLQV